MSYNELLEKLPERYQGDHFELISHTREFIESYVNDLESEVNLDDDLFDNGLLSEYAHRTSPIYYHDIGTWFRDNWEAVNEYFEEFGNTNSDVMLSIQQAYAYTLENELQDYLKYL